MSPSPRDVYVPADSWGTLVDLVAPTSRGMEPAFCRALESFRRYADTISGDIGTSIRQCRDHLERFLAAAQENVRAESGNHPHRLGRPRDFFFGAEILSFQVFHYRGTDAVSIREDRLASLLSSYDLFRDTMQFMENAVEQGDLGIFRNSFLFIHKPLEQAAKLFDAALDKTYLQRTTVIGKPADPHFVHINGAEPSSEVEPGYICRILKQGYAYEDREILEGVVIVAEKPA